MLMRGISNYSFMFNSTSKSGGMFSSFNFGDYAAIRNGSYKMLAKKQFANVKRTDSTDGTSTTNKRKVTKSDIAAETSNKIKSSVDSLKKSVNALNDKDLWKQTNGAYDTDKITKAIKDFASSYNGVVDQVDDSKSTAVTSSARWMNSLTNTMKTSLEKVGVKLGDDNKLTVDEETLKNADMKAVKAMFNGAYSYANQTAEKASSVASASQRDTSMYTSAGSYANMMSSWFNTSI